ncbi:helix-turn-helix domain-containing protein [Streptomyces sp. NPDC054838]
MFRKARMREESQVQRALWAQKECESEHSAVYDRRTALGLTPYELAQLAGLPETDVEHMEGGAGPPKLADTSCVRFTAHAA